MNVVHKDTQHTDTYPNNTQHSDLKFIDTKK